MRSEPSSGEFPTLFTERYLEFAGCRVLGTFDVPPDGLVAKLHLVAVTDRGHVLVCVGEDGDVFLPGGTREPDESLADLARRELREEAGAELRGELTHLLALRAVSERPSPYRPHLPHPTSYWSFAVGPAEVVSAPTNPPDGERVVDVRALPPAEAVAAIGENVSAHGDVVRLAAARGHCPSTSQPAPRTTGTTPRSTNAGR
ncbi:NUDIX hydrolase [Georgenia alba]|uniref:NUDIX hydrolase n=1 Tax=Georgenia alba TaxID=2233858 RepID=A0ABW2Q761_9MICO